jgi:hypothetical protein
VGSKKKYAYSTAINNGMNQKIVVYYHLYIHPFSANCANLWPFFVDEQLGLLKSSGLADSARVVVGIAMSAQDTHPGSNKSTYELVVGYIHDRYPWAEIIDVRDTSISPNLYEGQTLNHLYQYCQNNPGYVFYFHSKGMSRTDMPQIHDWRKFLQHHLVQRWKICVGELKNNDVAMVNSRSRGNFWWATTDYIRTLANPLTPEVYKPDDPDFWLGTYRFRYALEEWVWLNNPKIYYVYDTGDHEFYCDFLPANMRHWE